MGSIKRPILLYSDHCPFSERFLKHLIKYPDIFNKFFIVSIDPEVRTKQRPRIFYELQNLFRVRFTEVPTIIINNGEIILAGCEAFKWLEYNTQNTQNTGNIELKPFSPNEMGRFSDNYSKIDGSGSSMIYENASEQCFQFLGKEKPIYTPQDDGGKVTQDDLKRKEYELGKIDNLVKQQPRVNNFEQYLLQGQNEFDKFSQDDVSKYENARGNIDNILKSQPRSNFGIKTEKCSKKGMELSSRYESLLADRERTVPTPRKIDQSKVDFTTGRVYM